MKNSKKGFITTRLVLVIIAVLVIGGGVYAYVYMQNNPHTEYSCPDTQKLRYEQATNTYIQGTDCMPYPGMNEIVDTKFEQWVNKNCGIKFRFECTSY
jgi:hypothetical protein